MPRPMPSKNCPPGQARHKIPWSLLLNRSTEEDFERRGKNMGGGGGGSLGQGASRAELREQDTRAGMAGASRTARECAQDERARGHFSGFVRPLDDRYPKGGPRGFWIQRTDPACASFNNGIARRTSSNRLEIPFGSQNSGPESLTSLKYAIEFATARACRILPASCSRPPSLGGERRTELGKLPIGGAATGAAWRERRDRGRPVDFGASGPKHPMRTLATEGLGWWPAASREVLGTGGGAVVRRGLHPRMGIVPCRK